MEDLKKIQEFFSKPLEENVDKKYSDFLVALRDSGVTNMFGAAPYLQAEFGLDKREAREVLANWMRSFGESLNENAFVEAFKFEKALKGMGYDVKVKYLDDFGKDVFEIYFNNPADADESIFYDAKKLGYDNVRVFANPNESLNENEDPIIVKYFKRGDNHIQILVKYERPTGFTTALGSRTATGQRIDQNEAAAQERVEAIVNKLKADYNLDNIEVSKGQVAGRYYIDAFSDSFREMDVNDLNEYNSGIYYDPAKERNAVKAKEASKSGIEKVKDMLKKIMKEDMSLDDQAKAYFLAKVKKGEIDTLPDNPKAAFLAQMMKNQMGEALSDYEEKDADYDELYSDYLYKMVKEVATEKGFSKYLKSKDNPKGETDGLDTRTMNKILMNVIKDLDETIKLGKNLNEELCPKGKAYIKKRQAAGEKSSAYLSGRAVKVCKGQMKG